MQLAELGCRGLGGSCRPREAEGTRLQITETLFSGGQLGSREASAIDVCGRITTVSGARFSPLAVRKGCLSALHDAARRLLVQQRRPDASRASTTTHRERGTRARVAGSCPSSSLLLSVSLASRLQVSPGAAHWLPRTRLQGAHAAPTEHPLAGVSPSTTHLTHSRLSPLAPLARPPRRSMRALSSVALGTADSPTPCDAPPSELAAAPPTLDAGPCEPSVDALPATDSSPPAPPAVDEVVQSPFTSSRQQQQQQQQHVKLLHDQLDAHLQSQASPELDDLDEPLFFAARRRGRSADSADRSAQHQRAREPEPSSTPRRAKQRPASSYLPASAWASHLSHFALGAAGRSTARGSPAKRGAAADHPSAGAFERDPVEAGPHAPNSRLPTTPTRSRSASADGPSSSSKGSASRLSRSSPAPLLRHSLRLPFLPSIPASPLPGALVSPGLTHSASSPPILPIIATGGPLSPSFALQPPTASLSPPASWSRDAPGDDDITARSSPPPLVYRTSTSASAPNLSIFSTAPVSEASSYFSSPAPTAASSPANATVPLPLTATALGLTTTTPARTDEPLEYDPELLVDDAAAAAAEAKERADAAQLDEKRHHALVELVETERGYLEHLRVLVKVRASRPFHFPPTPHASETPARGAPPSAPFCRGSRSWLCLASQPQSLSRFR